MGPGGPHGLQLRWRASFGVRGGFDSLALPPIRYVCFNSGNFVSPAGSILVDVAIHPLFINSTTFSGFCQISVLT